MIEIKNIISDSPNEPEAPETLYKYRSWSKTSHKRALTNQELYFSAPSSFEDKLDCKFPIRWDLLSEEQIFKKYYLSSKKIHPNWKEEFHVKHAEKWLAKTPIKNTDQIRKIRDKDFEEYDKRIGVLILTENSDLEEMWCKYANNHKGFCIGFDSNILFKFLGGGGKVM